MAGASPLKPVDFSKVTISGGFFGPRMEVNRQVTTEVQYRHLVDTGRIDGIDPDYRPGDRTAHHIFWDSDVAKWMETAAYILAYHRDPELEARVSQVMGKFAKLQRPDGYINSWVTSCEPDRRFTNLRDRHELYCAGHLMEAAVAWLKVTGKRDFLDMMCRYVDYLCTVLGPGEGRIRGYPGHQEIELALIKLYRVTGNESYLGLAKYFVDERGKSSDQYPHYYDVEARRRGDDPSRFNYEYCQAHLPVRKQKKVVGHAVRAMYLYSAMADLAAETGDTGLLDACKDLWEDLCHKQMYVTGGIGQTRSNEGFTFHYDLPEETAYCETCASAGLIFWSHRLLQLEKDSQYADVMERALYNGALSGVSLSGDKFFYVNPLASLGDRHRQEWFACACCPGNISRLMASLGGYVYSVGDGFGVPEVWVHLYVQGTGLIDLGGCVVRLEQKTAYPWDGRVEVDVGLEAVKAAEAVQARCDDSSGAQFTLALRIPGWCREASLKVNDETVDLARVTDKGYARISRTWRDGDRLVLNLAMPVERVYANPKVRMYNGKVAIQRGPVVYCLEEADCEIPQLSCISLPRNAELSARFEPDLLGGVVVITGEAQALEVDGGQWTLYSNTPGRTGRIRLTAVPYYAWDNREPGQMLVWIRERI